MRLTRTAKNAVILAAFTAACLVGMEFLAINIGQSKVFIHGYRVRAVFADADGVPNAADVRVAGILVGKVAGISHDPAHPNATVVTMEINDSRVTPVFSDGSARVRPKTLLGEKFIDLTVGDSRSEPIEDMGMLPETRTSAVVETDQVFNAFDPKTRAEEQQVVQALDAATRGRAGDVQAILPQLAVVLSNLDPVARVYSTDAGQVHDILQNLDTVLRAVADEHEQVAGLLANGDQALGAIASRDQALVTTLHGLADVAAEANSAIRPTVQAQRGTLSRLAPTLDDASALLSAIVDPQAACGNRPCGIDHLLSGTLLGQINYPSDQLTVTNPIGPTVTDVWASMFQYPTDAYHSGGQTHSTLNLDFSWHCDTLANVASEVGLDSQMVGLLNGLCGTALKQHTATGGALPAAFLDGMQP